eukprot:scaffold279_cov229-Pinguiococcus_pyrenoidosus.AAC.28
MALRLLTLCALGVLRVGGWRMAPPRGTKGAWLKEPLYMSVEDRLDVSCAAQRAALEGHAGATAAV